MNHNDFISEEPCHRPPPPYTPLKKSSINVSRRLYSEDGRRDGGMEERRGEAMEGWRDGGMVGWRGCAMEGWRSEGMEEQRDGRRDGGMDGTTEGWCDGGTSGLLLRYWLGHRKGRDQGTEVPQYEWRWQAGGAAIPQWPWGNKL